MQFAYYSGFADRLARLGIEETADYTVKAGFTAVEFLENLVKDVPFTVPDFKTAAAVRKELDRQGLSVACYSAFANIWPGNSSNPEYFYTKEETFHRALEIAAELGSPYFHHTMLPWLTVPPYAPSFEDGIKLAIETAARVADYAKPLGITCIYEDQGQYVNGVDGFGAFYWELKKICSNVGVCGDFGNILFANVLPQPYLEAFKTEIKHVHVKDYLQKTGTACPGDGWYSARDNTWLKDCEVGDGIIDFKACLKILQDAGYTGPYALEIPGYEPFAERAGKAMEYLRNAARQ